ncbi:VIT1/CCC1 transporter family protein [Patescibacteria group bacterium]|nr:VIT1/CCC1 transporter family protein [Patescibacteria group bacterium]
MLDPKIKKEILIVQRNEITEHFIYQRLARSIKNKNNKEILEHISRDELIHYNFWQKITGQKIKSDQFKIWRYFLISKILGITFGIKLMEGGEKRSQEMYKEIFSYFPNAKSFVEDEVRHEHELINMIEEDKLKYVGSIVLGLNDALVELTGALAGLTFILQNTQLIALAGLITGIAASLSMAASEYLSIKSEQSKKNPLKASLYTGLAYILTVLFLIFPYFLFTNLYFSLGFTVFNAVVIIFIFTFYTSIVKEVSFKKRFLEMALISLSIATLTFIIGFLVRKFLNI